MQRDSRGFQGITDPKTSRFSISDVELRMFGETTRPSNEQTRLYTVWIREWEISLSRPSLVARRRLRLFAIHPTNCTPFAYTIQHTSSCNMHARTQTRTHMQNIVGVVAWQLRFQTSPPGTPVYCWFLLGVSCYLPLPGIYRLVGRSYGVRSREKTAIQVVLQLMMRMVFFWQCPKVIIFNIQSNIQFTKCFDKTFRANSRHNIT